MDFPAEYQITKTWIVDNKLCTLPYSSTTIPLVISQSFTEPAASYTREYKALTLLKYLYQHLSSRVIQNGQYHLQTCKITFKMWSNGQPSNHLSQDMPFIIQNLMLHNSGSTRNCERRFLVNRNLQKEEPKLHVT